MLPESRRGIWGLPNGQTTSSYEDHYNAFHEIIYKLERVGCKVSAWGPGGFTVGEERNPNSVDLPLWVAERFLSRMGI